MPGQVAWRQVEHRIKLRSQCRRRSCRGLAPLVSFNPLLGVAHLEAVASVGHDPSGLRSKTKL